MHVGYCISCYGESSYIFSVPISSSRSRMQSILGEDSQIIGEQLTREQLLALRSDLLGEVEVGWDDCLNYFVEGQNLPEDDSEWFCPQPSPKNA